MSEEENEAIKYLEFLSNEKCECDVCQSAKKKYKTILNLIKKQQKEIEEKRIIIFAGAEKVKQLEKEIEKLKEGYHKGFTDGRISMRYEVQDKIRERIEEARKIRWHIPKLVIEYFEELLEEE